MIRELSIVLPYGRLHGALERSEANRCLILMVRARPGAADGALTASLVSRGYAVLHFALLTAQEAQFPDAGMNIPKLSQRLLKILELIHFDAELQDFPLTVLASGEATPVAIRAAAQRDVQVKVLICHGGLADRAGRESLQALAAPFLMLTDPDEPLEQQAFERASTYLRGEYQAVVLTDEGPVPPIAQWLSKHFPR